jgi:hypothetical protein
MFEAEVKVKEVLALRIEEGPEPRNAVSRS